MTQRELASSMHVSQAAISRVERASNRVSLDIGVRALLTLGVTDAELSDIFNPDLNAGITSLRRRAQLPLFPRPRPAGCVSIKEEHRFVRKRRAACPAP